MKHNRSTHREKIDSDSSAAESQTVVDANLDDKVAPDESSVTKFANHLLAFAPGVADVAIQQAKKTIEQAKRTFEKGIETFNEGKKTLIEARATMAEVKASAKGALDKIRSNPEPYFAAIAPGSIGVYLLVEKWRKSQMG